MSESAEAMADRLIEEVHVAAKMLAEAYDVLEEGGFFSSLTENQQILFDAGVNSGYAATMIVLQREGLLTGGPYS